MKTHPVKGAAIMAAIPQLADVIPGMKYHHEKWERRRLPRRPEGEEIPLQARIVAVADTFDAMTTTRPYQQAMEIRLRGRSDSEHFAGSALRPAVVEALVRSYEKGELVPIARCARALEAPAEPRRVEAL